jgi:transmembrane sensor
MTLTDESSDTPRVQAEAAAWIALLHSPDRNAEVEAGLKRWIAANELHAKVWEAATDIWSETAGLPRRIPSPPPISSSRVRRTYLRPVLAVAVLCLTAAGVALQHFLPSGVSTAVGEQRTLNLEDGTRIELNTDSRVVVKYDAHTRTVILESGEAYFLVAHEHRPFTVVAGERKILALGTAFTVRRDDGAINDSVTVTLLEGRVAVAPVDTTVDNASTEPANEQVKVLNPGQRLRVRKHTAPALDSLSTDKATAWMRGQLIFDHTPLREAAAEFSRYNKVKISVASPQAAEIPIGGIFRIGDSRSFARAVAASYGLTVTQRGDELVLEPAQGPAPPEQ